jgi:branched-chain amino acid aminotransferase
LNAVERVDGVVSVDGELSPLAAAMVPVLDRGFLYGDAVFEALRTFAGEPDALARHLTRLTRSCTIVGIELGVGEAELAAEVRRALAAVPGPERYIRIIVTRGNLPDGLPARGAHHARRVVIVRPLSEPAASLYERGIRLTSCIAPISLLSAGAKPAGYLNNMLAIARAHEAGSDDALLLGAHGELLEGATSSLFLVQGGAVFTPPLALGILPGITRERVMSAVQALGLGMRERLLTIHDAYRAEELFLTSSVRQVVAVVGLDGVAIGAGRPGPLTRNIAAQFRAALQLDPAPCPG